ncbi:MAG TPA: Ku protein [Solirubrobacteraceae bacterium]|jgi:DNA end-binding protein Ku|nr:Ku protein [Solirubrobacteraceae bacterium]
MAPRSLWNGTIAFGLVRVPVKLHTATESKSVSFRERHIADGAAIEHRRVCVEEDREVPYSEIAKGFEVNSGSYVVLSKEEIAAAEGSEARNVDIEHFVDVQEIDPAYYERSYYLSPGKLGDEPYRTLQAALERSGKVGIGRFVFHGKAHLAAVRAYEDLIVLHTMRFADEFVDQRELEIAKADKQPSKLEVDTARLLLDQLSASFEPQAYADTYRDAVLGLIERKAHGEQIEAPASQEQTGEGELLSALRASLQEGHARKRRRPAETTGQPSGSAPRSSGKSPRSSGSAPRSSSKSPRSSGSASRSSGTSPRSSDNAPRPSKAAPPRPRRTRGEG